jgi:hypothetical protein
MGALVQVTGRYALADDTPAAGTVLLTPVAVAGMSDGTKRLITRHSVMSRLDEEGVASFQVLASDDPGWMTDGPVLYEVAEYIAGARGKAYQVFIPGPGPVDLADLQPVDEPQTVAPYPVPGPPGEGISEADGDARYVNVTGDAMTGGLEVPRLDVRGVSPRIVFTYDTGKTGSQMVQTGAGLTFRHAQDPARYEPIVIGDPSWTDHAATKRYVDGITLDRLKDVTAPASTPPNSLLGTLGDGMTAGVSEWEPLHLDYVQQVVLGPIPSTVADLSQRVTELEHTGEIVPPDLELTVDLYSGSFTRIIGCDPVTAAPPKRIRVTLATTPGPNGAVFTDLSGISGTGAVWADFGGTLGKVVDTSGTGINGAALKEAIRRGQIVTVHRGSDGSHPTLVVEQVENPADAGSSLTLDALRDVTAPASTPAGMVLGTTGVGAWGAVPNPVPSIGPPDAGKVLTVSGTSAVWAEDQAAVQAARIVGTNGVPAPWSAKAYAAGMVVSHSYTGDFGYVVDTYWWAVAPAGASDVPSVSPVWANLSLPALYNARGMSHEQADARYLGLGGGTLTGPLTVPAFPPPLPGNAIPKSYADSTYWHLWSGTQAQYDAIATKDPHTLYAITG